MYRLFGLGVVVMWVAAMSALFYYDVWPALTAQEPPPMTQEQFEAIRQIPQQYGIFNEAGGRIGTAWNNVSAGGATSTNYGTIYLDSLLFLRSILIETIIEFDQEGLLDTFDLQVYGVPMMKIKVHGERRGIFFPCTLQLGHIRQQANLDLSASQLIGDSLRPFNYLPMLEVGQSWRMQIVDPVSLVRQKTGMNSIVVQVTGKETIEHQGEPIECFVVETTEPQTTAWVQPDGQVIRQRVQVPGLGRISVVQEVYDESARAEIRKQLRKRGD